MMHRTPQEWAQYIREAHHDSVAAVIETGRRLREAHDAYKQKPRAWGQQWTKWCREELGLSRQTAGFHEIVAENMASSASHFYRLPTSWYTLYELSVLKRDKPDVFEAALANGTITPEITRAQVEEISAGVKRSDRQERDRNNAAFEDRLRAQGLDWWVEENDLHTWSPPVEAGKAKLILCDPPYAIEYLELYAALPTLASKWLGDEGWCAIMTGQRNLDRVIQALTSDPLSELEYVWTFALTSSGSRANGIQFLKVQNTWKPLIILRKGKIELEEWTGDVISYNWETTARVVQLHHWQQSISPFQKFIRASTKPNDLVVDPFCGSGTTGVAALSTGRHFAGCDIDSASVETTIQQLRTEEKTNSNPTILTEAVDA